VTEVLWHYTLKNFNVMSVIYIVAVTAF